MHSEERRSDEEKQAPEIVVIGADDLATVKAALQMVRKVALSLDFTSPRIDWEEVIRLTDEYEGLQVVDVLERTPPQLLAIADSLIRLAGYRLVLPLLDKALEKEPRNAAAHSLKAIALFYLGQLEETVACLDKAVELDPKLEAYTYMLRREATRLKEKYVDDPEGLERHLACEIQHELARTYKAQGDQEKALACYDRSLAIDPNNSGAWSMKGGLLYDMGKTKEAERCFRKALEVPIDEENRLHWFNRGVAYLYTKHFAEAMSCFERALALDPNYSQAKQNWFASHQRWANGLPKKRGCLEGELERVQRQLRKEPDNVTLLVMQGTVLMLLQHWAGAAGAFNEASRIVDERPVKRFSIYNHVDPYVQWTQASQLTGQLQELQPFLASAVF